jgi:hypothetical protein
MLLRVLASACMLALVAPIAGAQAGYEYEVYSTHIAAPRATTLELHTNFVQSGRREVDEGVLPSHGAIRSSFEVSHGLTPWLEGSVYFVGAITREDGAEYVGNRVRLTAVAPARWKLPFDLGISHEIGYVRPGFAENRWRYELSPIIGKSFGRIQLVLNPSIETGVGKGAEHEMELEPRGRISYGFGDEAAVSLEYYASLGPATSLEPRREQRHQVFATIQTELSDRWEIGFGAGHGLTRETDRTVLSTKVEYHLGR